MDRVSGYRSEVPFEVDFLNAQRFQYEGFGLALLDLLGTSSLVAGLACNPTSPASLSVTVGPGRIYSLQSLDPTDWGVIGGVGGLTADTNTEHRIVKQGVVRDTQSLALTAPVTPGQSINYLIQIGYAETDAAAVFRPFYNPADPTNPNSTAVSVLRADQCVVQAKAGTAATTGTQTTPTPDSGFVGLWVVTVAYGATALTGPNIVAAANAPKVLTQADIITLINARFGPTNPPGIPDVTGLAAALAAITPTFARNAIAGLGTSNTVGATATKITVAVGSARDSTNTTDIVLASPITKDLTATWVAGNNNGGRDSAAAVAALGCYHVFLIWNPSLAVDALFSTSATAPTLPTGYTKFRRIGSILTDSGASIVQYRQFGRYFELLTKIVEFPQNTANGAGPYLRQLVGVPIGVKVRGKFYLQATGAAAIHLSGLYDPDKGVPAAFGPATQWAYIRRTPTYAQSVGADYSYGTQVLEEPTNASGQIYSYSSDSTEIFALGTIGWYDDLGEFN